MGVTTERVVRIGTSRRNIFYMTGFPFIQYRYETTEITNKLLNLMYTEVKIKRMMRGLNIIRMKF